MATLTVRVNGPLQQTHTLSSCLVGLPSILSNASNSCLYRTFLRVLSSSGGRKFLTGDPRSLYSATMIFSAFSRTSPAVCASATVQNFIMFSSVSPLKRRTDTIQSQRNLQWAKIFVYEPPFYFTTPLHSHVYFTAKITKEIDDFTKELYST